MTEVHPSIAFLLRLALDEAWLDYFTERRLERALQRLEKNMSDPVRSCMDPRGCGAHGCPACGAGTQDAQTKAVLLDEIERLKERNASHCESVTRLTKTNEVLAARLDAAVYSMQEGAGLRQGSDLAAEIDRMLAHVRNQSEAIEQLRAAAQATATPTTEEKNPHAPSDKSNEKARRKRKRPSAGWGLVEALELITRLRHDLQGEGWGIGLAGSVLHTGWSLNDLDVICFPLSTAEAPSLATLHRVLLGNSLRKLYSAEQVREHWRGKGSLDEKHVEIWAFGSRRVDVFVWPTTAAATSPTKVEPTKRGDALVSLRAHGHLLGP